MVYARDGKLTSVRAHSVIVAGGSWTAKHIVKDLPAPHRDAYAQFYRAPCLMANVAVRNWRFLYKLGISECQWFEGIGNYTAVRKLATFGAVSPTLSPDSPVVLTLKILFSNPAAAHRRAGDQRPHGTDRNTLSWLRKTNPRTVQHDVRRIWDSMPSAISPA